MVQKPVFLQTFTMSFISEYRNIQSRLMLSFSRMSCKRTNCKSTLRKLWNAQMMCLHLTNTYESVKCNVKYLQAFKIFTCKLPLGQYSVTMQMFGGSIQAPINLVRWLNCTSLIYKKTTKWTFSVVSLLAMEENQDLLCNVNWAFESWTLLLKNKKILKRSI